MAEEKSDRRGETSWKTAYKQDKTKTATYSTSDPHPDESEDSSS